MLQGRLFSYGDTHRYRLGINHHQIPVNAARCPVHSYHRDGAGRVDGNAGGTLNYAPNSAGEWKETPSAGEPPLALDGQAAARWNHRQELLFGNIGRHMTGVPEEIQRRQLEHIRKADPAYAAGVAKALGLKI
ncbi:hypothetical protein G6F64_013531 [Rhizopus arrhizus]|uniref:catalase n=1 Tax=Rhizopus oryzae TaxID=64495 RepID=A0A9P7BKD5_RHIOR|nr:hypothetical protein G6F64_013531 [Rhizopus arrhizus]